VAYTKNGYQQLHFSNPNAPRVIVYPNNTTAAWLLNIHKGRGQAVVSVAECISEEDAFLPMPEAIMSILDSKINALNCRAVVIGIDAYISLLSADGAAVFKSELRNRLDANELNTDYLLSVHSKPDFMPRYQESRSVIVIEGDEEELEQLSIKAYSDRWIKTGGVNGYKQLLSQTAFQYEPFGEHTLILKDLEEAQAGIGNAITFVLGIRDVAAQHYGIDADLDDKTLEFLLAKSAESGKTAEVYLAEAFGATYSNIRLALKRLVELSSDNLWSAHIWSLRRRLPSDSYIAKVISGDVTRDNLLWKYVVDAAVTVLSDANANRYAAERAEALKAVGSNYESLIVEFIGQTAENTDALPFLNCGTSAERVEIIRRASAEELSYGLPKQYGELFPTLADYFSSFDYGDEAVTTYFSEYRCLKVSSTITDGFVKRAFDLIVPKSYSTRDALIAELSGQSDTALLVVDAMGVEYMPLLLAMAKRRGMNIESQAIVTAKLPTETVFNPIQWDETRTLPEIKSIDNIVHNGATKHEASIPERNFAETLRVFETEIMNRIADGLTRFARVVVTADHGATRLAVIARSENKGATLPWDKERDGEPKDWRYSLAPLGVQRPPEFESEYFPERKETYWIVRGYNRLPKMGGKLYELHGGATLEERLVPVIVFTKNAVTGVPKQLGKKTTAEIVDEFEGII
jgi:hypothetical protein